MQWVSPDFCDRVYHLLFTSSIKGLRDATSSRTWRTSAKYHLGNRKNIQIFGASPSWSFWRESFEESLAAVKENPHARITNLILDSADLEYGLKTLPYLTTDDESQFNVQNMEKDEHLKILCKVDSIGCFFTAILNLPYLSIASFEFLQKHIDRGILKKVELTFNWRQQHAEVIKGLITQSQLVDFTANGNGGLVFGLETIKKLISSIQHRSEVPSISFRVCTAPEIKRYLEEELNCVCVGGKLYRKANLGVEMSLPYRRFVFGKQIQIPFLPFGFTSAPSLS